MENKNAGVFIKKDDILKAASKVISEGKLVDLFKEVPHLILIVPLIASEIERNIFEKEE